MARIGGFLDFLLYFIRAVVGKHYDRNQVEGTVSANLFEDLQAGNIGEEDIKNNQIRSNA